MWGHGAWRRTLTLAKTFRADVTAPRHREPKPGCWKGHVSTAAGGEPGVRVSPRRLSRSCEQGRAPAHSGRGGSRTILFNFIFKVKLIGVTLVNLIRWARCGLLWCPVCMRRCVPVTQSQVASCGRPRTGGGLGRGTA